MVKINNPIEHRHFEVDTRAEPAADGRTISGYAAVFSEVAEISGWFHERIEPGAFDGCDMSDVRALFNHDANHVLARSKSRTLTLEVDSRGLKYTFTAPETTIGNDVLEMIRRGDISQSSFAFRVKETSWVDNYNGQNVDLRKILKIEVVRDVSPVTYPAYDITTVDARSAPTGDAAPADPPRPETPKTVFSERFAEDIKFFTTRL
ncbi:HK97 family phage prohead protease [Lewinella sp. JB7]|uniref:HK97 family phage prohead protease n=1 Tax=Lewinella sp. JB7 TaxID=2962887 RepID=UPI0020C94C4D|nr:HK97 family phage prohead protease [Lewinella sp. JB7]MCP9237150.1 HK97 family phage prohead protease [Lewinella sp. JB7]